MKEEITICWHWTDIQDQRESLTKEQCCQVLQQLELNHDCNIGINWDVINNEIINLFGEE